MRKLVGAVLLVLIAASVASAGDDDTKQWFREARFGMFIHWGLYAIPARGEWVMNNEHIPVAEYEKWQKEFNPTGFNADEWVQLAQDAGMKYMVITSKHHDGFCMFDSALTEYKSTNTPGGKDYMWELSQAAGRHGLPFGFYYSLLDWHQPQYQDTAAYQEYLRGQLRELCTAEGRLETVDGELKRVSNGYGKLAVLWFDGGWDKSAEEWGSEGLCNMIREMQPGILINNRSKYDGDFQTPEQEVPRAALAGGALFESCMTINGHWGYAKDDHNHKSVPELIHILADCASKGGNLLLNVGPTPQGTIQPEFQERLRGMGAWLKLHGDAIYGTEAGPFDPMPWGRCTRKGQTLYFILFDVPEDGRVRIDGLANWVTDAKMLATGAPVACEQRELALTFTVPVEGRDPSGTVVAVTFEGEPQYERTPIGPDPAGVIALSADLAELTGEKLQIEHDPPNLGYWVNAQDYATWNMKVEKAGTYTVSLLQSCPDGNEGSEVEIAVGDKSVSGTVQATGDWGEYREVRAGTIELAAGTAKLTLKATKMPGYAVMNLRAIVLRPVG